MKIYIIDSRCRFYFQINEFTLEKLFLVILFVIERIEQNNTAFKSVVALSGPTFVTFNKWTVPHLRVFEAVFYKDTIFYSNKFQSV